MGGHSLAIIIGLALAVASAACAPTRTWAAVGASEAEAVGTPGPERADTPMLSRVSQTAISDVVSSRPLCLGVPDGLIRAIIEVESGGDPYAVSRAGALGLMQVMPFHFRDGEDPFDPQDNIRAGCRVLRAYLERARNSPYAWHRANPYRTALAFYNAGPTGAMRGQGWEYAQRVLEIACKKYRTCLQ